MQLLVNQRKEPIHGLSPTSAQIEQKVGNWSTGAIGFGNVGWGHVNRAASAVVTILIVTVG